MAVRIFLAAMAIVWLPYGLYCFLVPNALRTLAGVTADLTHRDDGAARDVRRAPVRRRRTVAGCDRASSPRAAGVDHAWRHCSRGSPPRACSVSFSTASWSSYTAMGLTFEISGSLIAIALLRRGESALLRLRLEPASVAARRARALEYRDRHRQPRRVRAALSQAFHRRLRQVRTSSPTSRPRCTCALRRWTAGISTRWPPPRRATSASSCQVQAGGEWRTAFTFRARPERIATDLAPYRWYRDLVAIGRSLPRLPTRLPRRLRAHSPRRTTRTPRARRPWTPSAAGCESGCSARVPNNRATVAAIGFVLLFRDRARTMDRGSARLLSPGRPVQRR
jgi:hypothetical protein